MPFPMQNSLADRGCVPQKRVKKTGRNCLSFLFCPAVFFVLSGERASSLFANFCPGRPFFCVRAIRLGTFYARILQRVFFFRREQTVLFRLRLFSSPREAQEYRRPCGKSAGSWNKEGNEESQNNPKPSRAEAYGTGGLLASGRSGRFGRGVGGAEVIV